MAVDGGCVEPMTRVLLVRHARPAAGFDAARDPGLDDDRASSKPTRSWTASGTTG